MIWSTIGVKKQDWLGLQVVTISPTGKLPDDFRRSMIVSGDLQDLVQLDINYARANTLSQEIHISILWTEKVFNSCYYGGNQADVDWSTR